MIFRDRYYLNNVFNKLEDNHNMIRVANNKKRNLIDKLLLLLKGKIMIIH